MFKSLIIVSLALSSFAAFAQSPETVRAKNIQNVVDVLTKNREFSGVISSTEPKEAGQPCSGKIDLSKDEPRVQVEFLGEKLEVTDLSYFGNAEKVNGLADTRGDTFEINLYFNDQKIIREMFVQHGPELKKQFTCKLKRK